MCGSIGGVNDGSECDSNGNCVVVVVIAVVIV